jgi:hypothetical protein
MLRRIFSPRREEVREGWKANNVERHNLYFSLNIIKMVTSRRMS